MTWQVQTSDPRGWYRVFARHRQPDGTWGKPVRIGRATSSENLGVDDRGTVTALWLAGGRRGGEAGVLLDGPVAGAAGGIVRTGHDIERPVAAGLPRLVTHEGVTMRPRLLSGAVVVAVLAVVGTACPARPGLPASGR